MHASLSLDASITRDFARASSREWLETNGLGGWASSTVSGANTRRYHGLLVVATDPPVGRIVVLSRMDEVLVLSHTRLELGASIFPGAIHPQGHRLLSGFALDPFPVLTFADESVTLRKTVAMIHGEHTLVMRYELLRAPEPVQLELRPLFAGRDYHHLVHANDAVRREARFTDDVLHYQAYPGQPMAHILVPGGRFDAVPDWYYDYQYPREEERGLDSDEDLFSVGVLHCSLEPGAELAVIISTENPRNRDAAALLEAERARRSRLAQAVSAGPVSRRLAVAADQFVVRRADGLHTILAGYHWFTDWGRDTMIALPGICLVTGRHAVARSILQAFAAHISEGMIPNRFADDGGGADYNTVDATLWYFVAIHKYLQYTGDYDFVAQELWDVLQDVVIWHRRGTRYGIRVDAADGLLRAGEEGVQLTWMDAKVGDWVVTPRRGKAVEINALWYNVLRIMAHLARHLAEPELAHQYRAEAARTKDSFGQAFWNGEAACLHDVIGDGWRDGAVRPNQVFALSLPYPLLAGDRARQVLEVVDAQLYTACGLRSLSPADPAYCPRYQGGVRDRDGAYHQGTVWGWLMGPFLTALVRIRGEEGRARACTIIDGYAAHLDEAGLGSISEVFDAEAPHVPRGCIAQAWSVGELLRAYYEDVVQEAPDRLRAD